jgi:hypothetical protein
MYVDGAGTCRTGKQWCYDRAGGWAGSVGEVKQDDSGSIKEGRRKTC